MTRADIDYACPLQRTRPDDGPWSLRSLARACVLAIACVVIGAGFAMGVVP